MCLFLQNKVNIMRIKINRILLTITILLVMQSCSAIEGIFKAGFGIGVFVVFAVIALVIFVIGKLIGKK